MTETQTTWQRLWRSPWLWLVLALLNLQAAVYGHGWFVAVSWIATVCCWIEFFACGNKKWGKP